MNLQEKANKIGKSLFVFVLNNEITWHMFLNRRYFSSEWEGNKTPFTREGMVINHYTTLKGATKHLEEMLADKGFLEHYNIKNVENIKIIEIKPEGEK